MNHTALLVAMILMWIAVIVGTYQRIFEMPKWFSNPPASFELIRKQSKKARSFWIPLSILIIIAICTSAILYWQDFDLRIHILGGLLCFVLTGIVSTVYFVREVVAFSQIPAEAPQTPELIQRTKF